MRQLVSSLTQRFHNHYLLQLSQCRLKQNLKSQNKSLLIVTVANKDHPPQLLLMCKSTETQCVHTFPAASLTDHKRSQETRYDKVKLERL